MRSFIYTASLLAGLAAPALSTPILIDPIEIIPNLPLPLPNLPIIIPTITSSEGTITPTPTPSPSSSSEDLPTTTSSLTASTTDDATSTPTPTPTPIDLPDIELPDITLPPKVIPGIPTCNTKSFLLRIINTGLTKIDNLYAKLPSTYTSITTFTSNPEDATVFYLTPDNRLAAGSCENPLYAIHWTRNSNPKTNFWFETEDTATGYGDVAVQCRIGADEVLRCEEGERDTLSFCDIAGGGKFVSLLKGLEDSSVWENGFSCTGMDLVPVWV